MTFSNPKSQNPQSAIRNPQSHVLLMFIALNAVWRASFLPFNQSAYTDGILQIDMFRQGVSYWPPLYAVLTRLFSWIPGLGLEGGGRLDSLICGVALLVPLSAIARRLFGQRAAFWAMAAWTATPLAMQWSLQVMTDMPFALFWTAALAALVIALECWRPELFPGPDNASTPPDARKGSQWLWLASFAGVLATLTRYQGVLLLPPLALAAWRLGKITGGAPVPQKPLLTLLPWLAAPAWILSRGFATLLHHFTQIGQRTGPGLGPSLVNYWNLFESFLLNTPYFFTWGIFGFLLYGLFRVQWSTARLRWSGGIALYLALAILVMQSVFSSYQARYLLPLVPLACLFAGHGLAVWERQCAGRLVRFWGLALPALGFGLAFSALVAVLQGNPFKDLKDAAQCSAVSNLPAGSQIYCNEFYNIEQGIFAIKAGFWAGRPVRFFMRRPDGSLAFEGDQNPRPGDLIILSSRYAGGMKNYYALRGELIQNLPASVAHGRKSVRSDTIPVGIVLPVPEVYARSAVPLLTDIMQEAGTEQNPLAFVLRYQPQNFETTVLTVLGSANPAPAPTPIPGSQPLKPLPTVTPDASDAELQRLKALHEELQKQIHSE